MMEKTYPKITSKALTKVQQNAHPFLDDLVRSGHSQKRPLSNVFSEKWAVQILRDPDCLKCTTKRSTIELALRWRAYGNLPTLTKITLMAAHPGLYW